MRGARHAVVKEGRFVELLPDPSHPTGSALCAKGRAAPELVYHQDRLLHPLKRTRPKGDPDPGWQRITWEEALDFTASQLRRLAAVHGPESVVFSTASPSPSAIGDSAMWIQRLMKVFGSPSQCGSMEVCGWGRIFATGFTFGVGMGVPGTPMPDLEHAGCILFWGYNPSLARIAHATAGAERGQNGVSCIARLCRPAYSRRRKWVRNKINPERIRWRVGFCKSSPCNHEERAANCG